MASINHILHIINTFSDDEIEQLKTNYAYLRARGFKFKISLLYIYCPLPHHCFNFPSAGIGSIDEHEEVAKKELKKIGAHFDIDTEDCWIANGTFQSQALKLAKCVNANTILVSKALLRQFKNQLVLHKHRQTFVVKTVANIAMV